MYKPLSMLTEIFVANLFHRIEFRLIFWRRPKPHHAFGRHRNDLAVFAQVRLLIKN